MSTVSRGTGRQYWVALRAMAIMTVALGIVYPLAITGIGQVTLPGQSNGSRVSFEGGVVGSSLIAQRFTTTKGVALPQWFQPRPSATGYDANASGGSNLGPDNPGLARTIRSRAAAIEKTDGASAAQIPPDALTASGSGIDPHVSPADALLQVTTVAAARGLSVSTVRELVEAHIQPRDLGYLGDPTVNILELNLALAQRDPHGND
jgi:potassium-transporting ATPase KdpC subunit